MRKTTKSPGERIVEDIKRATRKHHSSEEKIRIVLDGLRGEESIAELCRREGISQGIYTSGPRTSIAVATRIKRKYQSVAAAVFAERNRPVGPFSSKTQRHR